MKIKLLREHRIAGQTLAAGKTADIPERDAKILIALRRAEAVKSKKPEDEAVQTPDDAPKKAGKYQTRDMKAE